MLTEITIIKNLITANMVNAEAGAEYKLSHVLIGNTEGIYTDYVPCAVIIPQPSLVSDQYIGQDTDKENINIRFYVSGGRGSLSADDTAEGLTKLLSMCEMFRYLVRRDPTFNAQLVACTVNSVNYFSTPTGSTSVTHTAEISITCLSRRLWNPSL